jgi:hypothetical protein
MTTGELTWETIADGGLICRGTLLHGERPGPGPKKALMPGQRWMAAEEARSAWGRHQSMRGRWCSTIGWGRWRSDGSVDEGAQQLHRRDPGTGTVVAVKGSRHGGGNDNDGSRRLQRVHQSLPWLSDGGSVQGKRNFAKWFQAEGGCPIYMVKYQQRFYVEPFLIYQYQQRFYLWTTVDGLSTTVLHRTAADSVL